MPNFRHRLTRPQQRIYDRSNAASSIALRATPRLRRAVQLLREALKNGDARRVQVIAQAVVDEICGALEVGTVHVQVNGTRPSNTRGELHGLYTQTVGQATTIKVWMITAKRGQVVAFRTFLRTLLHEVCHHLDYAYLRLGDSFHTDGFYKRESSLFYQIGGTLEETTEPTTGNRLTGNRPEAGKTTAGDDS